MTTDSSTGDWTPERIEEARGRCERATPGPWTASFADEYNGNGMSPRARIDSPLSPIGDVLSVADPLPSEADLAFIAHARKDLPAALDEIERLRVIETHARDMMRTGNHHADGGGRSSITVDSEPFDALEALFAPVFLAERKARRFAKVKP